MSINHGLVILQEINHFSTRQEISYDTFYKWSLNRSIYKSFRTDLKILWIYLSVTLQTVRNSKQTRPIYSSSRRMWVKLMAIQISLAVMKLDNLLLNFSQLITTKLLKTMCLYGLEEVWHFLLRLWYWLNTVTTLYSHLRAFHYHALFLQHSA